jgi:hypothetical protein
VEIKFSLNLDHQMFTARTHAPNATAFQNLRAFEQPRFGLARARRDFDNRFAVENFGQQGRVTPHFGAFGHEKYTSFSDKSRSLQKPVRHYCRWAFVPHSILAILKDDE